MTEVEQYLFDLQGYLIVEDVLDAEAVAELNRLIDRPRAMGAEYRAGAGAAAQRRVFDVGPVLCRFARPRAHYAAAQGDPRRWLSARPLLCDLPGGRCRAARVARRQYALRPTGVLSLPQWTDVQWADSRRLELGRHRARAGWFFVAFRAATRSIIPVRRKSARPILKPGA